MANLRGRFSIARFLAVVVVSVAFSSMASAYTLVMRSGRTVEIPDQFVISGEHLTYEVSPGIQVSVRLISIDIGKTEWANSEGPGSFAKRGAQVPEAPVNAPERQNAARRVVTNSDLDSFRARRLQSENAYEKRRVELGLPSVAASRARAAWEADQTRAEVRQRLAERGDVEQYWRGRASSLRTEMVSTNAQIEYVQNRLNEIPENNFLWGTPGLGPYGYNQGYPGYPGYGSTTSQQSSVTTITNGSQVGARIDLGQPGYPGRIYNGSRRPYNRRYGRYGSTYPYGGVLNYPSQSYDYSYERSELTSQLDQLNRQKTTLQVRWRELEEEARRAGAYPGWLRP